MIRRYCYILLMALLCALNLQAQDRSSADDSKTRKQIVEMLEAGEKAEAEGSQALAENYFQQAANLLGGISEGGTLIYKTLSGRRVQAVKFLREKGFGVQKAVAPITIPAPAPSPAPKTSRVDTIYIIKESEVQPVNLKVEHVMQVINKVEMVRPDTYTPAPASVDETSSRRPSVFVLASVSPIPTLSYGLMACVCDKIGGYFKFSSNWNFAKADYECQSDGSTDFGTVWTTGESLCTSMMASAGVCIEAREWLIPYLGFGYGKDELLWEDTSGSMVRVEDYSSRGIALEAGVIGKIGKLALSAGVGTVAFKTMCLELGVGLAL